MNNILKPIEKRQFIVGTGDTSHPIDVSPMLGVDALRIITKVTRTSGTSIVSGAESLLMMASGAKASELLGDDVLTLAVSKLFDRLYEDDLTELVTELLTCVHVPDLLEHGNLGAIGADGERVWSSYYRGRPWLLMQVVRCSIEVNFKDFIDAGLSLLKTGAQSLVEREGGPVPEEVKRGASPQTSTPGSPSSAQPPTEVALSRH